MAAHVQGADRGADRGAGQGADRGGDAGGRPRLRPLALARTQAGLLAAGAAALLASNAMALALPELLRRAIALLQAPGPTGAAPRVLPLAAAMAALALGQAVTRIASRLWVFSAGRNVEHDLRQSVFEKLLVLPPSFYRRAPTGELMSRLVNDLGAIRIMYGFGALNLVNTTCMVLVSVTLMWRLGPMLTLAALSPLPLVALISRRLSRAVLHRSRSVQEGLGVLSARVQEDCAGIAVVKGYALEPVRAEAFDRANAAYVKESLALARARGGFIPVLGLVGGVGGCIALWVGGRAVVEGRMEVGDLVAFNAYLVMLAGPVLALGWLVAVWQRGVAAWTRVGEILGEAPTIVDGPAAPPPAWRGELEVRDLTIQLGERRILDGVSLRVPAGGSLAIVGRTAAGKSTLVEAIPRLVEAPPGTIFLDGVDVTTLPLRALRRAIGYAPQDAFLFSATLFENLALGAAGPADPARIDEAVAIAGLTRDVAAFPDGLQTVVGERGITLSGGQRQRAALARALAGDPPVIILDDSLSSVDADTEQEILARLRVRLAGRTCVLISHRIAAVKDVDQIVVLDEGRIVERGRHEELLARGGLYTDLYRRQLLDGALGLDAAAAS